MAFQQTLQGHITPADKAANDYYYVPFTLPMAARRLRVRYTYSAAMSSDEVTGGNVIDLGLFDPRDSDFPGGAGFRGWSGSARRAFTIAPDEATPGYLPGPLPPGEYHVILGLYRIWENGADYEIAIEADLDADAPILFADQQQDGRPYPPATGTGAATQWLRGDLQSHTFHSDAKGSLEQLVAKARALGLDFLAVTDHNTISHHPHLATLEVDDLLLLYGQEVTTYYGHMNVWGTRRWCDFRAKTTTDIAAIIALAHAQGGLCSINHPKIGGPPWEYGYELPVDTLEVWQGPWPYRNDESLALWDQRLCAGKEIRAVGGSDYHCPAGEETNLLRLGQPTTWVLAKERSHRGVLEAIHAGRATVSAHPQGPRLLLTATAGDHSAMMGEVLCRERTGVQVTITVWRGAGYDVQIIVDGQVAKRLSLQEAEQQITVPVQARTYIRAEVIGDPPAALIPDDAPSDLNRHDWRWALSNPIFIGRADQ